MAVRQLGLASCLLACICSACARHAVTPGAALRAQALPGLNVFLTWSAPVDLDLYLTDPTWETVYFANNPSRTGGRLLRDARCRDVGSAAGSFFEQAHVADPPAGRYRIGVDFIDGCGARPKSVSFRVVADLAGVRRETTGTIRLEEFQPIVLEFALSRPSTEGPVALAEEAQR